MAEDNYTEKNVYYETKPIESIKIEIQKKVTAFFLIYKMIRLDYKKYITFKRQLYIIHVQDEMI